MKKLIWGCFHWAGFHLVREWLEKGETVIGIDTLVTEQKETLEMFIGRNANFSRFETIEELNLSDAEDEIDQVIVIDDHQLQPPFLNLENIPASVHFRVDLTEETTSMDSWITIDVPHVYGPWMKDSKRKISKESVYIKDVIPILTSIFQKEWDQDIIRIGIETDYERNDKNIIQSVSMEEGIRKLKDHQSRFSMYYN